MSLSVIAVIVIGLVLACIGVFVIWSAPTVFLPNLVVGLILVVVGVWIALRRNITL